jgi:hypothetical protein
MNTIIDKTKLHDWQSEQRVFSDTFINDINAESDYVLSLLPLQWFDEFLLSLNELCGTVDLNKLGYLESTFSWNISIYNACNKTDTMWLKKYYDTLPWYVSDIFNVYLTDKILELKQVVN